MARRCLMLCAYSSDDLQSLIYGEVDYHSFYRVLRKINAPAGSVFYDLGSGTGKAVFVARLTQDFSRCIGIEVLSALHQRAQKVTDRCVARLLLYAIHIFMRVLDISVSLCLF